MKFAFSDDQLAFRDAVRDLLARECTPEVLRAAWDGKPSDLWPKLAEMGVVGMTAPEDAGGLGMDELDLVLVLEETGRVALPEPVVETTAVAIPLLRDAGGAAAARWLAPLAAGEAVATLGLGSAPLVPFADGARLLVADHDDPKTGRCLHALETARTDLTPLDSTDGGRRLFAVGWEATPDTKIDGADAALAFDRAALGSAAQLLGLAERLITMAADYAKERHQFGKPVGSFQAVQHHLANALLGLEFARPVVYRAAHSVARADEQRSVHVSMAKAYASDAATGAARAALQVHGAIGYSWEHDLHLFMKRAWALASAWGDAGWHRRRIGDVLLGSASERSTNG